MNYKSIGFRAGLEIHQQIASHKLFCNCPSNIKNEVDFTFERMLRPTQSELGELDRAALAEAKRNLRFGYYVLGTSACGVEADEEPPHEVNEDALEATLIIALRLKSTPVDEMHWMRKIVIDGSNTAGFQRTGLVALGGEVDGVGIETIALEEDAARKIKREGRMVYYNLDRLGIPLVEISTKSTIESPAKIEQIAGRIGSILRSTKRVKRGIGTIRQDLNVSIEAGARVEIKGVQNLRTLRKVAEREVHRQLGLIRIRKELERRNVTREQLENQKFFDLTGLFRQIDSKELGQAINSGAYVLALRLPSFSGLIDSKQKEEASLYREFDSYTQIEVEMKFMANSDRLPNEIVDGPMLGEIKKKLSIKEDDAFLLVSGKRDKATEALQVIRERAVKALEGVPEEVRRVTADCSTEYMRPLPGAARMYPETDIPPVLISARRIESLKERLPPLPEEKIDDFLKRHKLSEEQAKQLMDQELDSLFEELTQTHPKREKIIARILLNTLPEISAKGIEINSDEPVRSVLEAIEENRFAKEAVNEVLTYLFVNPGESVEQAIEACKLQILGIEKVRELIVEVIMERTELVKSQGEWAFSPLMGVLMKELRGKVDGGVIADLLRSELDKAIKKGGI